MRHILLPDGRQGFFLTYFLFPDEPGFFGGDAAEQFAGGFLVGVFFAPLGGEAALHG
jgi:hypothetical protein